MTPDGREDQQTLFGHPKGLAVLAGTELWERFSFFGMQALLMLYMTKYLLLADHARNVLGLTQFRGILSATFGPMSDLAFATQTYGIYSGLIYASPLLGAWLGDRVIGKTKAVTIGTLLMAAGHLAMASEHFFLVALSLLIVGSGCLRLRNCMDGSTTAGHHHAKRTKFDNVDDDCGIQTCDCVCLLPARLARSFL